MRVTALTNSSWNICYRLILCTVMKTYFKLKRGILYSKTWINHQCFTCMFVTKQGLEYTGTVEWYQFIKDYTLLRRYINWMTVKLKTTEIGADIENCDVCPYVWNVHFLVWRRFKVKSLISIIFTTIMCGNEYWNIIFLWMNEICLWILSFIASLS